MRIKAILLFSLLFCSTTTCFAQGALDVRASEVLQVQGVDGLIEIGNGVYLKNSNSRIEYYPVGMIRVITEAENVDILIDDKDRNPIDFEKIAEEYYRISRSGEFYIDVVAFDSTKNIFARARKVLTVGEIEPDPPGPDPPGPDPPDPDPPEPSPDAPMDVDSLHVLIVFESGQATNLKPGHREIMYSQAGRGYLRQIADQNWKIYDKDVEFPRQSVWSEAMKRDRQSLPWLIVSNSKTGYEGPLPDSFKEFEEIVNKYAEDAPNPDDDDDDDERPTTKLIFHYKPGCGPCERFENEVVPYLQFVDVTKIEYGASRYPTLIITSNGKTATYEGFRSLQQIRDIIEKLNE